MDFYIRDKQAGNAFLNLQPLQTRVERVVQWFNDLRATGNRIALGGVIVTGAVVSLIIGMVLGGAFEGIDVALPPPGHAGTTPIIRYAAPASASHTTTAPRPATAPSGSTKKKALTTTTTSAAGTTTTAANAVLASASGPPSTTTSPTSSTTTTSPTTTTTAPPPPTTTTQPNPLCQFLNLPC